MIPLTPADQTNVKSPVALALRWSPVPRARPWGIPPAAPTSSISFGCPKTTRAANEHHTTPGGGGRCQTNGEKKGGPNRQAPSDLDVEVIVVMFHGDPILDVHMCSHQFTRVHRRQHWNPYNEWVGSTSPSKFSFVDFLVAFPILG